MILSFKALFSIRGKTGEIIMLIMSGKPAVQLQEEGRSTDWTRKIAYFEGTIRSINRVANERIKHGGRQLPRARKSLSNYRVKVLYRIDHEGFTAIEGIWVAFPGEKERTWSCFYEFDRRWGNKEVGNSGQLLFFYLEEAEAGEIADLLLRYEEAAVVRRLAKAGPTALPDIDSREAEVQQIAAVRREISSADLAPEEES